MAKLLHDARQGVVEEPDSAAAWGRFGAACDVHLEYRDAVVCYRRARALAPDDYRWPYLLAIALDSLGTAPDEVVSLLEEASRLEPGFPLSFYRLGEMLGDRGELEAARDAYRKALDLNPNLAVAHFGLGQILLKLGEVRTAVDHFERVARMAPNDGPVFGALAQAYMRLGERRRARDAAERSRRLEPALAFDDPVLQAVYDVGVSSRVCLRRISRLLAKGGRAAAQAAMPYLKTLEEVRPNDPYTPLWHSFAYLRTGRRDAARAYLDKTMRLRAEWLDADAQLSPLPQARHRLDEAIREFWREYLQVVTGGGNRKELVQAVSDFEQAVADLPLDAGTHLTWGNAWLSLDDPLKAIEHYREAARLDPNYPTAYYNLGFVLEKLGRIAEAIDNYKRAVALDPNGPAARRLAKLSP